MYENAAIANENARLAIMKQGEMVSCLAQLSNVLSHGLTMSSGNAQARFQDLQRAPTDPTPAPTPNSTEPTHAPAPTSTQPEEASTECQPRDANPISQLPTL